MEQVFQKQTKVNKKIKQKKKKSHHTPLYKKKIKQKKKKQTIMRARKKFRTEKKTRNLLEKGKPLLHQPSRRTQRTMTKQCSRNL